jgi:thiamine-monophosphate kinase
MEGIERLAAELGVTVGGGDLTRSNELFVVVTAVGHAASERDLAGRDGAKPGDLLGVTGRLGGAGAGLILLECKGHGLPLETGERLIERQRRPRPLLETGRALVRSGITAMIDVSDGPASDAMRIAEESGVALTIDLTRLPLDDGVDAVAEMVGRRGYELAATAGEDYELLFTAAPQAREAIAASAESKGTSVTWIGSVDRGTSVRLLDERGGETELSGWDHFSPGA